MRKRGVAESVVSACDKVAPAVGEHISVRRMGAANELLAMARLTHERPNFGIASVESGGRVAGVSEEVVHRTPFCSLLRFKKDGGAAQPRVLLVAPMSGHFTTLLRGTVQTLLRDHDVYITDWHNARDVPLLEGQFDLDDFIEHIMRFLQVLGPGAHLVAVCQPTVGALAAVALMAADGNPAQPATMTLMAGPMDTRVNPTKVNELAASKPIEWFEQNLIGIVPLRFAVGQTLAAQDMCPGIRPYMKEHHMQAGVGHYGVFNGRRWDNQIYPHLREFIHSHE